MGNSISAVCCSSRKREGSEPQLLIPEREAVADLLNYLENRDETDFFTANPLAALSTLSYSNNIDLNRSAALAFAEITEKEVKEVGRDTLEPILYLLQSHDVEVQRASCAALGNLAVQSENKNLIVQLGGLEPLIRQMLSPNVEVQCNAVGCITNLATYDENKNKIAKSGALVPLTRLAKTKDLRVQRNATGALLNMTHSDENRQQLVNAGAIPILVALLNSVDQDVQYYCTTALSNIAVDPIHRQRLQQTEPRLVELLVKLMDSPSMKVQCQSALALRNLASDEKYQVDIVKCGGLPALLRLLRSSYPPLTLSAAACVRNISIHPLNEAPIIESGFLGPLIENLAYRESDDIQAHSISTLRNLAASSERNKIAIIEAGAIERIINLVLQAAPNVQSEMTACVAVLALSNDLKSALLERKICEILIPLTTSTNVEVQGNSAAALGNLSSKIDDYSPFCQVWDQPHGGLNKYLLRFLSSHDSTFQHIAVWTLSQLLEGGDPTLAALIRSSSELKASVAVLAECSRPHSRNSANSSSTRRSDCDAEHELEGSDEIAILAEKIIGLIEGRIQPGQDFFDGEEEIDYGTVNNNNQQQQHARQVEQDSHSYKGSERGVSSSVKNSNRISISSSSKGTGKSPR